MLTLTFSQSQVKTERESLSSTSCSCLMCQRLLLLEIMHVTWKSKYGITTQERERASRRLQTANLSFISYCLSRCKWIITIQPMCPICQCFCIKQTINNKSDGGKSKGKYIFIYLFIFIFIYIHAYSYECMFDIIKKIIPTGVEFN